MTVYGGSHTDFDAGAFTAGAVGGAATVAGALVAGVRNAAQRNLVAWDGWNRGQLITAVNLSEGLRLDAILRAGRAEAEVARLRTVVRRLMVRPTARA